MHPARHHSSRGSALLAVLCFTAVLAVGVTSYITLCHRSLELSSRSFQHERAWQLAEAGLERALWALNHDSLITGFDGWTPDGSAAERTFNHDLEGDISATVFVRVEDVSASSLPRPIIVTSSVTLPNGTVLTRQFQCTANPLPTFINAIAGINSVDFESNTPVIDSYRSASGVYGGSNIGYAGIIAGDSVHIHKAQVKGYLNAGINAKTLEPDYSYHEAKGKGKGSVSATLKGPDTDSDVNFDLLRIGSHVNQPLPDIKTPTGGTLLPAGNQTLGTVDGIGPDVYYVTNDLNLNGSALTIEGPVQIRIPGSLFLLNPTGSFFAGRFVIEEGGSLEIFIGGMFYADSRCFVNESEKPSALAIYSNATYLTVLRVPTNGPFHGVLYFPNTEISIQNPGHFYGSMVAKHIAIDGNTNIHYDMNLRDAYFPGLKTTYGVLRRTEVIASN